MPRKRPTTRVCKTCNYCKPLSEFHRYESHRSLTGRLIVGYSHDCLECRAKKAQNKVNNQKKIKTYRVTDKVLGRPYSLLTDGEAELYRWFIEKGLPLPKRQGGKFIYCNAVFDSLQDVIQAVKTG